MNNVTVTEKQADKAAKKGKVISALTKILLYAGIAVGGIVLLVALYQIVQYLFVGALLLIAWLGPGKWRL